MWMSDNSWATPGEEHPKERKEAPVGLGTGMVAEGRGREDSRLLESHLSCR